MAEPKTIPIVLIEFPSIEERNKSYKAILRAMKGSTRNVLTYKVKDDTLRAILAALSEAAVVS